MKTCAYCPRNPEFGVAPGQAGVIYSSENDRLVLGGWIVDVPK